MVANKDEKSGDKSKMKEPTMPSQRFEEATPNQDDSILPFPSDPKELHNQLETLNNALLEAQEKASSYWERLLRKEAEFQNLLKRAELDAENARKSAIERFAGELIQVLDSLDQGLGYAQNDKVTLEDLKQGMLLTQTALMSVFEKQGIQVIDPQGQTFDPKFHEALSVQETNDVSPNTVLAVIQKGYMLQNRLLRPARVVVSKTKGNVSEA